MIPPYPLYQQGYSGGLLGALLFLDYFLAVVLYSWRNLIPWWYSNYVVPLNRGRQ
nr:MAG TPA: hypothetical protein [Caudoviricetes sp.]